MADPSDLRAPTLSPYLYYEDGAAALDWLAGTFGFRERFRMADGDGNIAHAEMDVGDSVIMVASPSGCRNPARLGGVTCSMHVNVDDVDDCFGRALDAGAGVIRAPADQEYGVRNCGVVDPEGHHWWFSQPLS